MRWKLWLCLVAVGVSVACSGPLRHVPADKRWLRSDTGQANPSLATQPAARAFRMAVYGDSRGDRAAHAAVVAAIRTRRPDLVVFTGDALNCLPRGHMPDWGAATCAVPLWPQYIRGKPGFSLLSLVPFPALVHEVAGGHWRPVRDPHGFNAFLEETAPLRLDDGVPLVFVAGNHDVYHKADRKELSRLFRPPPGTQPAPPAGALWYGLDVAGCRLLVLDSGSNVLGDSDPLKSGGRQLRWLEQELAAARQARRRCIVAVHMPPFSSCVEDGPSKRVSQRVVPLLERYGAALVLSGHAHAYERIVRPPAGGSSAKGITYIITGGGGADFHSQAEPARRDPHSRAFAGSRLHFALLEIGPGQIRGRMVPVDFEARQGGGAGADFEDQFVLE